jgi:PKD repeat protein
VRFVRAAGGAFADLFTLTQGPPPANQPPTASFSSSAAGLTASLNATASSDSDGTIASYGWAFGDGDTTTLSTPQTQHTYANPGTYNVTLTVTDDDGDTDAVTHPVTVTQSQTQVLASDLFARTLVRSWGSADVGGPWTVNTAVDVSGVDSGEAWMSMTAPAKGPAAYLPGPTSTDLDLQLDLRLDKVPAGGSRVDQSVILRRNANGDYRAMVRVLANGSIRAGFARTSATGVQTVFGPDVTIPGLTYAAGETLKVRAQATGTSPTTVRVKVWKSTATEPAAWTATATDSTAGLQALGSIGLHVYLGSSATNAPIKVRYDNLRAVVASTLP